MKWTVGISNRAEKQLRKLPESVRAAYAILTKEMEVYGPFRANWSHYGKLRGSKCALSLSHFIRSTNLYYLWGDQR